MPSKIQSILLAGLAIGVANSLLGQIPMAGGCLACLAVIGAGVLAVWHYTGTYELTLSGGQGAGLGAMAGCLAMIVASAIGQLLSSLGVTKDWREAMEEGLRSSNMEPEQMDQFLEIFSSPLAFVGMLVIGLIIYAIAGAIGGAIGASMFKKGGEAA